MLTREQRKQAREYTDSRFTCIERKTTYTSRCYEEWYEVWETTEGDLVNKEDVDAFRLQPRGQGHGVEQISPRRIKLSCICDSGD